MNPENRRRLEHIFHYHRGSAWFTTAGEGAPEEAIAGYEKALVEFERRSGRTRTILMPSTTTS